MYSNAPHRYAVRKSYSSHDLYLPLFASVASGISLTTGVDWPTIDKAVFVPISVADVFTFSKISWYNGTAVAGNIDAGLYDASGNRIISTGLIAQAGVSANQTNTVTTTTIKSGVYYLAIVSDTSLNSKIATLQVGNLLQWVYVGIAAMASARPLPSTATFAETSFVGLPSVAIHS